MLSIVRQHTLPMAEEAEELQIRALVEVLPVRFTVLDLAGTLPQCAVYEPGALSNSTNQPSAAASRANMAANNLRNVAVLHTTGHYDVVYLDEHFHLEQVRRICC